MGIQDQVITAIDNDWVFPAQSDQFLVVIENRIWVREGSRDIDLFVVRVDFNPRGASSKASVLTRIPLDGRAGVVTAFGMDNLQRLHGIKSFFFYGFSIHIPCCHVPI